MEFAQPYALALAALAVPVLALAVVRRRRGLTASSACLLSGIAPSLRIRLARLLPLLRVAAIVLFAFAAAGPRIGDANAIVPAEGLDIALSMDISSSMTSSNLGSTKTRLEATKEVIQDFIKGRKDDRIGLVVFRREALALSPPTLDYRALDQSVETVESLTLEDGTGIGVGLASAVNMLRESTAASRIVILLTDGQHNAPSIKPIDAAALAESLKIRVYTIGVVTSTSSATRSLEIDETLLTAIADATGGRYFSADNQRQLAQIYDEIGKLEKSGVGRERFERFRELGPWFVLPAAGLLLLDLVLGATLLRRTPV